MKPPRSSRDLIKRWHRGEKSTIDQVARSVRDVPKVGGAAHSPFTASGQAVEDQVRKAWLPHGSGLPVF